MKENTTADEKDILIQELKKSLDRFRLAFLRNPDAIVMTGFPVTNIVEVNDGFINMSGFSREEVIGKSPLDLRLWAYEADREKVFEELKRNGAVNNKEIELRTKNGSIVTSLFSSVFIEIDGEKYMLTVVRDITEMKRLERILAESEEKFRLTFDTSPDVMTINRMSDGLFVEVNQAFIRNIGYSREEISGKTTLELNIWTNPEDRQKLVNGIRENGFVDNLEAVYKKKDGSLITALMSAKIILIKNVPHLLSVSRDITDIKLTREKLKKTVEKLEQTNDELEKFAYATSHDLQEPLRMVTNYVQLLRVKYRGKIDKDADYYIDTAVTGAVRMSGLIKELLDLSRLGRIETPAERVDMNDVLKEVKNTLSLNIAEKGADVAVVSLPVINADRFQMVQLMQNLLSNAIKFSAKNGAPKVTVDCTETPEYWQFRVKDNGIGIASKYFDKIFVVFQQLNRKDEYEGAGIGLSICKKIVESHKGKIWVESEEGKGAEFFFTIKK